MDQSGQMDMQQLLAAAQQMQHQLMSAQQELADTEVEELVDLTISAAAIDVTDPAYTAQSVADLVLAAVRDACRAAGELQQEKMGPLAALGGPGGPGEVPGLSEFFGGGGDIGGAGGDEPGGITR